MIAQNVKRAIRVPVRGSWYSCPTTAFCVYGGAT